ncbi:DUS22 phosphatase, partial [Acromyrmex insinuator]
MEERGGGAGSGAHLAVIAGIFATSGSLLGKLAGGADASSLSSLFLKGVLLIFMIVCNTIGCTFFVKALHASGSSLPITVASAATNYICSKILTSLSDIRLSAEIKPLHLELLGSELSQFGPADPHRVSHVLPLPGPSRQICYEISTFILAHLMAMNLNGTQIPADGVRTTTSGIRGVCVDSYIKERERRKEGASGVRCEILSQDELCLVGTGETRIRGKLFARGDRIYPTILHVALAVLPGLYVGNYQDSKDADQLERFEITHILAIHDTARRLHSDKHYLCILAADSPDQNLSQYFSLCNDFIHAARLRGGNVLIHCLAGMSRSVTVAVAYIMSTTSLSWKEALKVVRVGRSIANPNVGFQQQLKDFESSRLQDERNRLKERFPSLALTESDAEACRSTLRNYETLALAKEVCEGKCAMGRTCPTGLCRQATKRTLRRKSSTSSIGSVSSGRTPPQTPRMLPSAPPSPALHRSSSVMSTSRPRSGPAGLHSYTGGSAPPSRAASRVDLSAAVACSSSNTSLSAIGRSSAFSSSNWRLTAGSAPNTPRPTPPVSPQRWPRRLSNRQTPQLPAPPESHPSTMT